jgi:ribosomal protein L21E
VQPGATPDIVGDARFGATLSFRPTTWGPGRVELAYQWLRAGQPIRNATGTSYRLVAADIGNRIRVQITGSRAGHTSQSQRTATVGPVQPGQLNPATPAVSGPARVGERLTGTVDPWGPGAVRLAWQWFRDDSAISGATSTTYRVVAADRGRTIRLRIRGSATNFETASRFSQRTGVVDQGRLDPTPIPLYSGIAEVGEVITALPKQWGPGNVTLAYQWFRSDGGGSTAIAGATGITYRLKPADLGERVRVRVTGSRTGFTTVRQFSGWTTEVGEGQLQGVTPEIAKTLTVDTGEWGPGDVDLTIRWYRSGTLQTRALDDEYELGADDVGHTIVARVIGTRKGFADLILESEPVGPVVGRER